MSIFDFEGRKPRSVRNCRTNRQFTRAIRSQGGRTERAKKHDKVYNRNEILCKKTMPRGTKEFSTGTRYDLIKALKAIGFVILPFVCGIVWLVKCLQEVYA